MVLPTDQDPEGAALPDGAGVDGRQVKEHALSPKSVLIFNLPRVQAGRSQRVLAMLSQLTDQFGVNEKQMPLDDATGRCCGHAVVTFEDVEAAERAVRRLDGAAFDNSRTLRVVRLSAPSLERSAAAGQAPGACEHSGCLLQGPCCRCAPRVPGAAALQGLQAWALRRQRPADALRGRCRFFCAPCAERVEKPEDPTQWMDMPFGGRVIVVPGGDAGAEEARARRPSQPAQLAAGPEEPDWALVIAGSAPRSPCQESDSSWIMVGGACV